MCRDSRTEWDGHCKLRIGLCMCTNWLSRKIESHSFAARHLLSHDQSALLARPVKPIDSVFEAIHACPEPHRWSQSTPRSVKEHQTVRGRVHVWIVRVRECDQKRAQPITPNARPPSRSPSSRNPLPKSTWIPPPRPTEHSASPPASPACARERPWCGHAWRPSPP